MLETGRNFSRGALRPRLPKQVLYKETRSSMVRDQERVEACHNCGKDMSPAHQCQEDQECDDSDVSEDESSDEEQVEEPCLLSNRAMIGMLLPMIADINRIAS